MKRNPQAPEKSFGVETKISNLRKTREDFQTDAEWEAYIREQIRQAHREAEREGLFLEEEEERNEVIHTAFIELSNGLLAEEAYDGKEAFFLLYDPKTDSVEKVGELRLPDGRVVKPIFNEDVRNRIVLLPSEAEEYGSEEELRRELREFLDRWHEAPDDLSRELDVEYVRLTYFQDLLPQLPYRRNLAPWGRGKSAWIDAVGSVCYRAVSLAGCDTDKSIVRTLHLWRGTALIDEADFGDSSLYAFIIKILNIGYDRRRGWYRRCDDNNQRRVVAYYVYGAKLLATRKRYRDVALESRCITTIGRENVNPMPLFRMERFEAEAQRLRNKLILWRLRNYHRFKEMVRELESPEIAERLYDGAEGLSSRVKQIILPLWLIAGDSMRKTLVELAQRFDAQLKAADPAYQLEAEAREAVRSLVSGGGGVNVGNVVNVLYGGPRSDEAYYQIPLNEISKRLLELRGYGEVTRSDIISVSKRLVEVFDSRLGFPITIGKRRARVVLIPAGWVKIEEPSTLKDFLEGDSYKDIHDISNIHALDTQTPSVASVAESLTEDEKLLAKIVEEEESVGLMLLRDRSGLPRDRFEAVLRGLEERGLIQVNRSLGVVSWRLRP